MRIYLPHVVRMLVLSTLCTGITAQTVPSADTHQTFYAGAPTHIVTLYPPMDPVAKKYDEGKACFSFKHGDRKDVVKISKDWELGYGFLSIGEEDWFTLSHFDGSRSVMKDLGELKWEDPFVIPALEPLPELPKGQPRQITVDSSGDTHEAWEKSTTVFAKVALGHIYLVHVKDEAADFYALFRVEEFEQHNHCTISWRLAPSPKIEEQK